MFIEWHALLLGALLLSFYLAIRRLFHRFQISDVTNRHVFITGCDTGFGYLLARSLDAKGVFVIAGCLTKEGASDLRNVTSSRLKTVNVDVSDEKSIADAFKTVSALLPGNTGLWGLVNNAGIMPNYCPAELISMKDYKRVCDVNLFGAINTTLTFLPLVRKAQGRIVNVCSVVANIGIAATASYSISKSGLSMFTTCLRRELYNSGISVHSIEPGGFRTNVTNMKNFEKSFRQAYNNACPELKQVYGGHIAKEIFRGFTNADAWICSRPQLVADAMDHALLGRFPKLRYLVGPDIYIFFGPLMYVPEWIVDYATSWPKPYGPTFDRLQENSF